MKGKRNRWKCIETGKIYESNSDLAKAFDFSLASVVHAHELCGRKNWMKFQGLSFKLIEQVNVGNQGRLMRQVWECTETGRRYASAKELARSLHYNDHYVSERSRKEGPLLEIDGQHYLLIELNYRANSQAVRCVENGKKFKSLADASRWANVHYTAIAKCCRGELKTAGGYHWRRVNK